MTMGVEPADIRVAQMQMVDGDIAGDGQARALGIAHAGDAFVRRQPGKMHGRARDACHGEDGSKRDCLGTGRNRRQSQPHGDFAVVRDAASGKMGVLRPQPDAIAERRRVLHRAQQNLGVRQRSIGMRERNAAGVGELAHFGDRFTLEPGGQRAYRIHMRQIERASAVLQHLNQARLVQRRVGVGRTGKARDPARDRCLQLRFESRLVFEAGLPQARGNIDQSGADDHAGGVDHPVGVPSRRCRADGRHLACGNEERSLLINAIAGIDQAAIVDLDLHRAGFLASHPPGCSSPPSARRCRTSPGEVSPSAGRRPPRSRFRRRDSSDPGA